MVKKCQALEEQMGKAGRKRLVSQTSQENPAF